LEAKISLVAITFFAGIQYVFLSNVQSSVSCFAFLSVTSLIGFLITFAAFFSELFRISKRQILQSALLAVQMFLFNVFLLLGSSGMDPAVTSFVLAGFLVFIPVIYIFMKKKVSKSNLIGTAVVLLGLVLALEADPARFDDARILFLLAAAFCFALNIVTVEQFCDKSNPSILAMGRMFFGFIFAFICWTVENLIMKQGFTLPVSASFWSSVMFISIFIGGFYCVVQIYAQRYVNAMETALIFSAETVVTLLMAPLLAALVGSVSEPLTPLKLAGCTVIVTGVLIADGSVFARPWLSKEAFHGKVR
jgi:drug/metabolite transporter (DMT)-like permease